MGAAGGDVDDQNARDLFDYIHTLTPGEALNGIGFLADAYSGPRLHLALRVHPGFTAASLGLVLTLIAELSRQVAREVEIDTGATAQLRDLVNKSLTEAAGPPRRGKRRRR